VSALLASSLRSGSALRVRIRMVGEAVKRSDVPRLVYSALDRRQRPRCRRVTSIRVRRCAPRLGCLARIETSRLVRSGLLNRRQCPAAGELTSEGGVPVADSSVWVVGRDCRDGIGGRIRHALSRSALRAQIGPWGEGEEALGRRTQIGYSAPVSG
jgi:hypothetical protein